ncbi:Ferrochelatase [Bienertia sinuspersici]
MMKGYSKAMLVLTILVGVTIFVEGVKDLKENFKKEVDEVHPENFFGGGLGGIFPSPTSGTTIPGIGGPRTGPGVGSPVDFCSIPGLSCVRVQPTNPGSTGASGGQGGSTSNTPLPFP